MSVYSVRLACACHHALLHSNIQNNNRRSCLLLKAASYYATAGAHSTCTPTTAQSRSVTSVSTEDMMTRHSSSYVKARPLFKDRELTHRNTRLEPSRIYCSAQATAHCWKCKQPLGGGGGEGTPAFFCPSCKVVQPPSEDVSYFKIMACDRTFTLDTQQLQKRYLQLQRSLHPDNFSQKPLLKKAHNIFKDTSHPCSNYSLPKNTTRASNHAPPASKEQEYSEQQSALVNKAYGTLQKPLSRGLYMLELEGMHIEEGTDPGADAQFLLELMEINEAVDEAQSAEDANSIGESTKARLKDLTEQIDTALHEGQLQVAKALLVRMKYFANIEDKVKEKLSDLM